jgi:hypothetical protein
MFQEIIAVYSENHTKPINTLCGQNTELLNIKAGGTYSYHYALKGSNGKVQKKIFGQEKGHSSLEQTLFYILRIFVVFSGHLFLLCRLNLNPAARMRKTREAYRILLRKRVGMKG